MRIVIDSNRMQSDELEIFLSLSPNNKAVLTDYAAMEAFQGDTLISIQGSWSVLRHFPKQLMILKGTRQAGLVDPYSAGMADRFASKSETKGALDFARVLDSATAGDWFAQKQLLQRGEWANDHMAQMLLKADDMAISIEEFCDVFTETELRRVRRGEEWKCETAEKFLDLVAHLTELSFKAHPSKPKWPRGRHIVNHFLYRHTFTYCIYMMELVKRGTVTRKAQLVRNDAVDVIFATYATYFNGFMSMDEQASIIHRISRGMLKQVGARIPEDYMDGYFYKIAEHMTDVSIAD